MHATAAAASCFSMYVADMLVLASLVARVLRFHCHPVALLCPLSPCTAAARLSLSQLTSPVELPCLQLPLLSELAAEVRFGCQTVRARYSLILC